MEDHEMETESANGTQTAERTTPDEKSAQLRKEWAALERYDQDLLNSVAEEFVFGEDSTLGRIIRMVRGEDGRKRRKTVQDILEDRKRAGYGRTILGGDTAVPHIARIVAWLQSNQQRDRLQALLDAHPRHRQCLLENYIATTDGQRKALAAVTGYCDDVAEHVSNGRGMILNGPVGTGKTHLLFGAARKAIGAGFTVQYRNVQALLSAFRSRMDDEEAESENAMIDTLVSPDVLILDDVISPHGELTSYQEQIVYIIVEERYSAMRPTWAGLNAAGTEDAVRRIGAAIVDRLKDGALCLAFDWPSHRKAMG
jgi:DNA replication protein DnaC